MKKTLTRFALVLLLAAIVCPSAWAQYHYHPHYHGSYRSHRTSGRVLRGIEAVETVAEAAMLGGMLHGLDDYTGIRLGYNNATLRLSNGGDINTSSVPAFNIGIVFGWYLGHTPFAFEPGFYYSGKGGKLSLNNNSSEVYAHWMEVPFTFKYNIPLDRDVVLQPLAGPYIAFGFAGTTTDQGFDYDTFDDHYLDDFDAGLRFGAALSFNRFCFEAAYDLGLVDINDDYSRKSIRTGTWSFNIGVNF